MIENARQLTESVLTDVLTWMGNHPKLAAPVVALVASWILYGVLGRRYLGADDDYWPALRRRIVPILDQIGRSYGLSATTRSTKDEYVGVTPMSEEELEKRLEGAGYHRNPLAGYKRSPQGWKSDGSWAKRQSRLRWLGDYLRENVPVRGRGMIPRFLQSIGEILALRQTHVTIYTQQRPESGDTYVYVFAHRELNSLNPVTAFPHYRGIGLDPAAGVDAVKRDFKQADIPLNDRVS